MLGHTVFKLFSVTAAMRKSFTRKQLYDLVWSESMKTAAARYGVSDVAFAKMCKRGGIPIPFRGYWAKVQAGKKVSKTPLPARELGMAEIIQTGSNNYWQRYNTPDNLINAELPPPPEFEEPINDVKDRVEKLIGKVTIPKTFDKAHRSIQKLLEDDEQRRLKQLGQRYPSSWDAPYFQSPFERRRLRLINALMIALMRSGFAVSMRGKNPAGFDVKIGGESVSVTFDSNGKSRNSYFPTSEANRPASDKLTVKISAYAAGEQVRLVWEDTSDEKVESHCQQIAVNIALAGELKYRAGELHHHNWLVGRKAQLIEEQRKRNVEEERLARERRIAAEKARVDRLLGEAEAFRQAADIRGYVEAVRNTVTNEVTTEEFEKWSEWALAQANRIDPLASKRFLENIDYEDSSSS
ncbi:hypothetical protein [Phyllobacterium sp. SB3]|uniref:hypothetical protein n=1 Tax=Phyllobacterium sp. SB3 TaxID=3156073 RepID=UPI0032AFFE1D